MKAEGTVAEVLAGAARFAVVRGDAVEALRALPDGCAHVCYCDPSYGLATITTTDTIACLTAWLAGKPYEPDGAGFMGHKWDAWVPGPEAWREVHRALRPGGYCVAYSSTRTVDLLGIAVRLAGFEMREGWAWVFGSGFPKSLDVSKAIDAAERFGGSGSQQLRARDGNEVGTVGTNMHGHMSGRNFAGSPGAPVESADAAQWDGYGTTTKPCFEPLIVARKPLDGTVAHNVTTHGCGALNIDAARVTHATVNGGNLADNPHLRARHSHGTPDAAVFLGDCHAGDAPVSRSGRFPAALALVHDEECERVGARKILPDGQRRFATQFPRRTETQGYNFAGGIEGVRSHKTTAGGLIGEDGLETVDDWHCTPTCAVRELARQSGELRPPGNLGGTQRKGMGYGGSDAVQVMPPSLNDPGTAARFFWQAKAAASDRLAFVTCTPGCAHHETIAVARDARRSATCPACGAERARHEHATVKPLDLARYHARLLSLPAHVAPLALVPYCGSGPEARALLEVGFRVIAVDLDPRHCAMTRHRLSQPLEAPQPKRAKRPRPSPTEAPSQPLAAPVAPAVVAEAPTPVAAATKPARGRSVAGQLSLWGVQ